MQKALAFALTVGLLLAGCMGGSEAPGPATQESTAGVETSNATEEAPVDEFVPKFHTHDYWSGRDKLVLFGPKKLEIGSDVLAETTYEDDRVIIGRVDFDTKTDGEQVNLADATDVVFQGTSHILLTVKWTDMTAVPGLRFFFKPANTPTFTLLGPIASGETYEIPLKPGWADMPHQLSLSRWKFRLEAFNPTTSGYPVKPFMSRGTVEVYMEIVNGGEQFIDPPHPYFFQAGPSRYAGEVNATLNNCVVVNNSRQGGQSLPINSFAAGCHSNRGPIEYKVEGNHIVPWETTKAVMALYWNYTGPAGAAPPKLGLMFHASDSDAYRYPKPTTSGANFAIYEVGVTEAMTDSPYATQSDWRYGVYPIIAEQRDAGGAFSGTIHIHTTAIKEGETSGRGMGN